MKTQGKTKLCYILPSYHPDSDQHFAHLPRFLRELDRKFDLYVIVERGSADISLGGTVKVFVQQRCGRLGRSLELLALTLRLRKLGCRKFFIRISVSAALLIAALGRTVGFETYYWSSGQGRNILPQGRSWSQRWVRFRYSLRELPFRMALRLTTWVVTGPEGMGSYYAEEYKLHRRKIIILYNDIDISAVDRLGNGLTKKEARTRLGLSDNNPVMLFVGRVSPLKGGAYIVPVIEHVRVVFPEALCIVIGILHLPEVVQEVRERGLEGAVHLVGPKPNLELAVYFRAADVFFLPSNSEGFPRVLLESMAYAIPFVAFDVGGIEDIVDQEQKEWIIPRGDVKGMADRICRLISDPALREKLVRIGRERVRKFSTEAVAEMFVDRIVNG